MKKFYDVNLCGKRLLGRWLLVVPMLLISLLAQASHFRYGDLSWRTVQSDPTGRTIEFKVSAGWRLNVFDQIALSFGDGTSGVVPISYANIGGAYSYGTGTITKTYATAGNYTVSYGSCCKISTLQNNRDSNWFVRTNVAVGSGNSSPVSTVPAVVNLQTGLSAASYLIPATDPDGQALTFSLANSAQHGWPGVQPAGLSINAQTGELTFNTTGKAIGQLWNAAVAISDGQTTVVVDFILQITQQSSPPQFDYAVTPANQQVFQASPGQTVSFPVRATDIDAGSTVRMTGVGIPSGAAISPAFGVAANPVQHSFSWTPGPAQFGTFVVNFIAEDNNGVQASTSVAIIVTLRPRFDVPPTPAANHENIAAPGQLISYTVQASDPDPNDQVRITAVQGRQNGALSALYPGASFSPLPTAAANPTSGTFAWTPTPADWGYRNVVFTATDSYGDRATHEISQLINTVPVFSSVPVTTADVARPYTYSIVATDPDMAYGDSVRFVTAQALPAWLTLSGNLGDGTAVLSGTPPVSAAGTLTITLMAEDLHHHAYHHGGGVPEQTFTLVINNCTVQAAARNLTVALDANGQASITAAQIDDNSTASCGVASRSVSPSAFTCANLGANPVTLTVTDVNGNESTASAVVTVQDTQAPTLSTLPDVTVNAQPNDCSPSVSWTAPAVADNCAATVSSSHQPGDRFAVGTTTVTYTATDAAGNQASTSFRVTVVPAPVVVTVGSPTVAGGFHIGCAGAASGSATAAVQGGCQPYRYQWSSGQTTATARNLTAGTYSVTVTDANGTTQTQAITLTQPAPLALTTSFSPQATFASAQPATIYLGYGLQQLTLSAAATGGVPGYQYSWSPAAGLSATTGASVTAAPLTSTVYAVTVTDQNGCTTTQTVAVRVIDARCGNKNDKVLVCHNGHEICISPNGVAAHIGHGCSVGPCVVSTPARGTTAAAAAPAAAGTPAPVAASLQVEAYPNPNDGQFRVRVQAAEAGATQVDLYDLQGRRVQQLLAASLQAGEQRELQPTQRLASGLYLVRVQNGGQVQHLRVTVQR